MWGGRAAVLESGAREVCGIEFETQLCAFDHEMRLKTHARVQLLRFVSVLRSNAISCAVCIFEEKIPNFLGLFTSQNVRRFVIRCFKLESSNSFPTHLSRYQSKTFKLHLEDRVDWDGPTHDTEEKLHQFNRSNQKSFSVSSNSANVHNLQKRQFCDNNGRSWWKIYPVRNHILIACKVCLLKATSRDKLYIFYLNWNSTRNIQQETTSSLIPKECIIWQWHQRMKYFVLELKFKKN